ncbi:hypothetical protein J7L85_01845 [candidate division WOR-3 bacterium]|nr:hypothetical protein [candidate division WOR-3 bacterium]
MRAERRRRTVQRINLVLKVFYVLLLGLLLFVLLMVSVAFSNPEYYDVGIFCTVSGLLPIFYAIYAITNLRKEFARKNALSDYLLSRERVSIGEVAAFLSTTPEEAYEELLSLEESGYLTFSMEPETGICVIRPPGEASLQGVPFIPVPPPGTDNQVNTEGDGPYRVE